MFRLATNTDLVRLRRTGPKDMRDPYQRVADLGEYWVADRRGFYDEHRYNEAVKRRPRAREIDAVAKKQG